MGQGRRAALDVLAGLAALLAGAPAASAVEYRLRVVSIHEQGFYAYLKPGEQSVFVIAKTAGRSQEGVRVALRGVGPMRQYQVYVPPGTGPTLAALRIDLGFLWSAEERGDVWTKYVAPVLDLGQGMGVVVGANAGARLADHAYLIVRHAGGPTTYEAVLAWRQSPDDRQTPADHPRHLF